MDLDQTLQERCTAIGLDMTAPAVKETIRATLSSAQPPPPSRTARTEEPPRSKVGARMAIASLDPRDPREPHALREPREPRGRPSSQPASRRELPRISVDLRGSLPTTSTASTTATTSTCTATATGEATAGSHEGDLRDLQVIRTIGEGGMGRVFLARQHSLDREVAIKTVRDAASEHERAALLAEGAVVGHLEHPGVVPVHALGVDADGRPVLVMKHVEGAPWSDLLEDPAHAAWRSLGGDARDRLEGHVAILMHVCNAVEFAHSRGIVHRDIKPQNVLVGRYGEVVLADWGLALRVDGGVGVDEALESQPLCGTPAYMAPEMVTGSRIDRRTDVYLLGATLHQVLTGQPRHAGGDVRATLMAAARSQPPSYPRSVPEALARIAAAATEADPDRRPSSAAEVRDALDEFLRHRASLALADSAQERLARLRAYLEDAAGQGDEARQRELDVVAAEVRFALGEALRQWADNPRARAASEQLEALLEGRRSRAAELERLARELDPQVSQRHRAWALAVLAIAGIGMSLSAFFDPHASEVSARALLLQSLLPLAVVLGALLAGRRQLLGTTFNRRLGALIIVVTSFFTLDRAFAMGLGLTGAQVLVFDGLGLAALFTVGAFVFFRWLGWNAALAFAGALVAAAWPAHAMEAFSTATGVGLLLAVYFSARTPTPGPRRDGDDHGAGHGNGGGGAAAA